MKRMPKDAYKKRIHFLDHSKSRTEVWQVLQCTGEHESRASLIRKLLRVKLEKTIEAQVKDI